MIIIVAFKRKIAPQVSSDLIANHKSYKTIKLQNVLSIVIILDIYGPGKDTYEIGELPVALELL